METTIIYWGYLGDNIGIMEKKMEATVLCLLFLLCFWVFSCSRGLGLKACFCFHRKLL